MLLVRKMKRILEKKKGLCRLPHMRAGVTSVCGGKFVVLLSLFNYIFLLLNKNDESTLFKQHTCIWSCYL